MTIPDVIREAGMVVAGRYLLAELLGAGGMGVVFRAHDRAGAGDVAIKFLHPSCVDPEMIARFRREVRAASRLRHPHSVAVLDSGVERGRPYLVMEYIRGASLRELVRGGAIARARALAWCGQILSALDAAHRLGIVHADVKTDNIIIEDWSQHAKLVDFGLARQARGGDDADAFSGEVVAGTPAYMAPEILEGGPPDARSDVFAAGVVLHELVTGAKPFPPEASSEVAARLRAPLVPPSLRFPDRDVPRWLDAVILRALATDPAARFVDASEFAATLAASPAPQTTVGVIPLDAGAPCGASANTRPMRRPPLRS